MDFLLSSLTLLLVTSEFRLIFTFKWLFHEIQTCNKYVLLLLLYVLLLLFSLYVHVFVFVPVCMCSSVIRTKMFCFLSNSLKIPTFFTYTVLSWSNSSLLITSINHYQITRNVLSLQCLHFSLSLLPIEMSFLPLCII